MRAFYVVNTAGQLKQSNLESAFPFLQEKGHVVSLVGAGGKTTMLYLMAQKAASFGRRVLVTTTTHMMIPPDAVMAWDVRRVHELWEQGTYAVIGAAAEQEKKLCKPDQTVLKQMMSEADLVLIESDGAKHFPCKVPASHEPVILPECDIVVGVAGLSALGKPIGQTCFRKADVLAFLNRYHAGLDEVSGTKTGQIHTSDYLIADELAAILASCDGTAKNTSNRKYYVCLNQCDNEAMLKEAVGIAMQLQENGIMRICMTGKKQEKE